MSRYTCEDWNRDGTFAADPGQEVDETIYEQMLNVLPPFDLPRCKATDGYTAGFMVSEPVDVDRKTWKNVYSAFGIRDGKYYYIGLLPRRPAE